MANDPGPCHDQFEEWKDEYEDWEDADKAADKAFREAMEASALALGVCGATWWIPGVNLIGCGAATANALYKDGESIAASSSRDDAYDELLKAKQSYIDCTKEHKEYYAQG